MNAIRPPILRSSLTLDRSLFERVLNVAAARVKEGRDIAKYRKALIQENEALRQHRLDLLRPDPDQKLAAEGRKCILLKPDVLFNSPDTWGKVLKEAVAKNELSVIPYELHLDYDFWDYRDVMQSVLPEEVHDCIPTGFNTVGHVAHLNLRDHALPYKKLIGEVLRDKNPQITTVINKIDQVGEENEFRTFNYEVLAGEDDLNVEVREGGCVFRFDYAKVYWNSKLETEHTRLVELFRPGEVICDVMAGVGPFALPAGKKGAFVWANDMNPESFRYLQTGIGLNKVRFGPTSAAQRTKNINHMSSLGRLGNLSGHSTMMAECSLDSLFALSLKRRGVAKWHVYLPEGSLERSRDCHSRQTPSFIFLLQYLTS
jgi:tRNA (guanine37-N1)-methyltransferase